MKSTKGFEIRLKYLLQQKGMSERELARKIGCSHWTVNSWTNRKTEIAHTEFISAICREFNVKAEWLLYGRIERRIKMNQVLIFLVGMFVGFLLFVIVQAGRDE